MNASDRVRLQHMLDAAREALLFAQGRTTVFPGSSGCNSADAPGEG